MKDLKEIKYKTDKYDEEGNPIYITVNYSYRTTATH